jgi:hypothetical protein
VAAFTDADYELVTAVEITTGSVLAPTTDVLWYFASRGFTTAADDEPASTHFEERIRAAIIDRQVLTGDGGRLTSGLSGSDTVIELDNTDDGLDGLLSDYFPDGRLVTVKCTAVAPGQDLPAYADFTTAFVGRGVPFQFDGAALRLGVQGLSAPDRGRALRTSRLKSPLLTTHYGGGGGADGTEDLTGIGKPQAYGVVFNMTPQLVDPSLQIFQVHDGEIEGVAGVYSNGAPFTFWQDFPTYAELAAAVVPLGAYGTCVATGHIVLNPAFLGTQITCDVVGDKFGNRQAAVELLSDGLPFSDGTGFAVPFGTLATARTTAEVAWRILEERAGFTPDEINQAIFLAFATAQPGAIGYDAAAGDDVTIEQAIQQVAMAASAFVGDDRLGRLFVRRIEPPALADVVLSLGETDEILDLAQDPLPYGVAPSAIQVTYHRTWTVQTDAQLAAGASDTRRALVRAPSRLLPPTTDDAIVAAHPAASVLAVDTLFDDGDAAAAEALRLRLLYAAGRRLLRVTVKTVMLGLELGDCVKLTFARYGLSGGAYFIVLGITEDLAAATTTLRLFGGGSVVEAAAVALAADHLAGEGGDVLVTESGDELALEA